MRVIQEEFKGTDPFNSHLRALVQGGTSTTLRNDAKPLVFVDLRG